MTKSPNALAKTRIPQNSRQTYHTTSSSSNKTFITCARRTLTRTSTATSSSSIYSLRTTSVYSPSATTQTWKREETDSDVGGSEKRGLVD